MSIMPTLHDWPVGWIVAALFVAWLIGALYVYAPIKVRSSQVKDLYTAFFPIELTALPIDVSEVFYAASRALASLRFESVGTVGHHLANTSQDGLVSVWVNRATRDSAQIIGVRTPNPAGGLLVVTLVTFRTEFTDGTTIATSNNRSTGCFPRNRMVASVSCPGIDDIALLYRFHRARVQRDLGARIATLDDVQDAIWRMEFEHTETFQRLIQAGYFVLDEQQQRYVPTWKGAYLMTYNLLPPFKQIRKFRRDRLADRTLRELGFGGMAAFAQSQSFASPAAAPQQVEAWTYGSPR